MKRREQFDIHKREESTFPDHWQCETQFWQHYGYFIVLTVLSTHSIERTDDVPVLLKSVGESHNCVT